MQIDLVLNKERRSIDIRAGERLLDMIRRLGLKGAKEGCGEGHCGGGREQFPESTA